MTDEHSAHIDTQVRAYMVVFVSLLALTVITVAIAKLHLPTGLGIAVALSIAAVKGSLVALYFMHLISERKVIFLVLIFTAIFFLGCLLLPTFAHIDAVQVP
jgi:cytochrome c oxidase subunit 4